MVESHVIRFVAYGTSIIVLSELIYCGYRWLKTFRRSLDRATEINEILWINELSESCTIPELIHKNFERNESVPPLKSASIHKCNNLYCSKYNMDRLIQLIEATEYSIDLAMYTFTLYNLSQALQRAAKRGVSIRILSDQEMAYSSGSQIVSLSKLGIPVRCNSNLSIMHHKFCILDSPSRRNTLPAKQNTVNDKCKAQGILISGSLNWTLQGFSNNWENVLITSNVMLIEKFTEEFERLWQIFQVNFQSE